MRLSKRNLITLGVFGAIGVFSNRASAHVGGLNAQGSHNNRKTGGYHCHRGPRSPQRPSRSTSSRVNSLYSSGGTAQKNGSAHQVSAAQPALKSLGHYHADIDGRAGALTRDALLKFQSEKGLTATVVTDEALYHLVLAVTEGSPCSL